LRRRSSGNKRDSTEIAGGAEKLPVKVGKWEGPHRLTWSIQSNRRRIDWSIQSNRRRIDFSLSHFLFFLRREVGTKFKEFGYAYVTLNLQEYRSESMDAGRKARDEG
jgi:hypothetical protein